MPVPADRRLTADDLPAYRRWYTEIAEGRRTFRFEGDPTEYDLDGPASAEKLARIRALRERETDREERRERNKAETPVSPAPSSGDGAAGHHADQRGGRPLELSGLPLLQPRVQAGHGIKCKVRVSAPVMLRSRDAAAMTLSDNRRQFFAGILAAGVAPALLPARRCGPDAPSQRIALACPAWGATGSA